MLYFIFAMIALYIIHGYKLTSIVPIELLVAFSDLEHEKIQEMAK